MLNRKFTLLAVALGVTAAFGCTPDEYPSEPRFEVIPDEGPVGHLFQYNVLPDVEVTSVNLAGSFQGWDPAATDMPNTWLVTLELDAGTYEYKYVFNGPDGWAGNMCDEGTWGDPDNDNFVDPNSSQCTDGGNAILELEQAGTYTFMYIVPESAPEITSVNLAGSFQGWDPAATPMMETYSLWLDLEPGEYEYKFVFNGPDGWADMCNNQTWGDPDNSFLVDANGSGQCADGGNAILTID